MMLNNPDNLSAFPPELWLQFFKPEHKISPEMAAIIKKTKAEIADVFAAISEE